MLNPKQPRKCGICGKRRKVYGFSHCSKKTYTTEEKKKKRKVYISVALEGYPRLCQQCISEALSTLNKSIRKFVQRKMIDEKIQIYTV